MLDITATTTRLTQPIESIPTVREAGGRSAPQNGTDLPPNTQPKPVSSQELPKLERLAEGISDFVRSINRDLTFRVDEASGHTVVTVIDGETKEVIRQIPSEEFLRMAQVLENSASLILDTEA